jgi:hypothetical protein
MLYNYQFVTTYTFYNKSLYLNNPISCQYSYEKEKEEEEEKKEEEEEEEDYELSDTDEDFTSKYLYDTELLHAFDMIHYDANILSDKIFNLYNYLKSNRENYPDIDKLLQIANDVSIKYILRSDEFNGFMILFAFDYFHITHLCICDIFNEDAFGIITKNNLEFLMKNISL